jgi:hypothetical protein
MKLMRATRVFAMEGHKACRQGEIGRFFEVILRGEVRTSPKFPLSERQAWYEIRTAQDSAGIYR